MDPVIQSFLSGAPVFIAHFGLTVALLIIGVAVYHIITPHHEMQLIREGNTAAAISLGGVIIGLGLPLAFSMANSVNLFDILLWGVLALVLQIATFFGVNLVLRGLAKRIEEGEVAAAILLSLAKLAVAAINAAALTA